MITKGFNIDSIGIEFEYSIPKGIDYHLPLMLAHLEGVNRETPEFTITLDREYYKDQIEFKLVKTSNIVDGIAHFQQVMKDMFNNISPLSATTNKHFVGTHIHMFLTKDGEPYTKFAQGKKVALVEYAYTKMRDFLIKSESDGLVRKNVLYNEMSRLTTNHNILRYFDNSIGDVLRRNLEERRLQYQQFHSGSDRPKYAPVLWSLANEASGKPHSLEIRCIPNTYFLLTPPKDINEYIQGVPELLNSKIEKTREELIASISGAHKQLINHLIQL